LKMAGVEIPNSGHFLCVESHRFSQLAISGLTAFPELS
jgi:hypothetical protein